jgi:hypothetical protein
LVTFTLVPNGKVRCAAVNSLSSKGAPLAVKAGSVPACEAELDGSITPPRLDYPTGASRVPASFEKRPEEEGGCSIIAIASPASHPSHRERQVFY